MNLKQRTITGVLWTGMAKTSMQGVLFIVTAILARLLSKEDFGIVGMAALITVAISLVNDRGLGTAIVQKKQVTTNQLSSLFWGGLGFGILLFLLSFFGSFPLSAFFANQMVQPVVVVFALDFIIGSFGIVQKSLLTREMDFKKLSIIETASVLVSGVVSIAMALMKAGVWSLVAQTLVRDVVNVVLVWRYCHWRPTFFFSASEFREMFGFSAKVLANDLAYYFVVNADVTIVGKVLGAAVLGSYSLALNLVKLPITRLSGIVSKVAFPAFSSVQDDLSRFKRGYAQSMAYISLITFPILALLGLYADEFIQVVFGGKWSDMAIPLMLLVPMAMFKSVGTLRGSVLMACGKPQIELWWNLGYLPLLAGSVYLGTRWGLIGAAAAYTILYLSTFPIIQIITNRQVKMTLLEFCKALQPAGLASLVMILTGWLLRWLLLRIGLAYKLGILILGLSFGIGCYVAYLYVVHRNIFSDIRMMWRETVHHRNANVKNSEVPVS